MTLGRVVSFAPTDYDKEMKPPSFSRVLAFAASLLAATALLPLASASAATSGHSRSAAQFPNGAAISGSIASIENQLRTSGKYTYPSSPALIGQIKASAATPPNSRCLVSYAQVRPVVCRFGDLKSKTVIVLMGDSHAFQWLVPLTAMAARRHVRLDLITKAACPVSDVTYVLTSANSASSFMIGKPYHACTLWRNAAFKEIRAIRPQSVVISSQIRPEPTSPTTLADGLTKSISILTNAIPSHNSKHVVYIEDIPDEWYGSSTATSAQCLARSNLSVFYSAANVSSGFKQSPNACFRTFSYSENYPTIRTAMNLAATTAGATVVDPTSWICDTSNANGICPPVIGGTLVYRDSWHLTDAYAARLSTVLGTQIPSK